jgi:hypothetical protein
MTCPATCPESGEEHGPWPYCELLDRLDARQDVTDWRDSCPLRLYLIRAFGELTILRYVPTPRTPAQEARNAILERALAQWDGLQS